MLNCYQVPTCAILWCFVMWQDHSTWGRVKHFGDLPVLVEPSRLRRNRRSCRKWIRLDPPWDNMAEPQQTRRHSPPGRQKLRISYICQERIKANLTVASRGIFNESVGVKFTRNRYFFLRFSVSLARPEIFLYCSYWDPTPERGVPWG